MKTKLVALYADLSPGWHDHPDQHIYVNAYTQPSEKLENRIRVKILVELPVVEISHGEDSMVNAAGVEVLP